MSSQCYSQNDTIKRPTHWNIKVSLKENTLYTSRTELNCIASVQIPYSKCMKRRTIQAQSGPVHKINNDDKQTYKVPHGT